LIGSTVTIYPAVKYKGLQTTDDKWLEKLIWAFYSGKHFNRLPSYTSRQTNMEFNNWIFYWIV